MKPVAMSRHAVLLSVLVLVLAPHTFSKPSSQDQYEQQANPAGEPDKRQPVLHRVQLTSTNLHRFGLLPLQNNQQSPKVPDLQVGCADGSVKVPKTEVLVVNKKRHRRSTEENTRKKRDHYHRFLAIPYPIASPYVGSSISSPPFQYGIDIPTLYNPQPYSYHGPFPFHNYHPHRAVLIFNYTPKPVLGPATSVPDSAENMTVDIRFGVDPATSVQDSTENITLDSRFGVDSATTVPNNAENMTVDIRFGVDSATSVQDGAEDITLDSRFEEGSITSLPDSAENMTLASRFESGPTTTLPDNAENVTLDSRFGGPEDEDEHPSWGFVESDDSTNQQEMRRSMQHATTYRPVQTTTPPSRSASTSPPLFHRPSHGESGEDNDPNEHQQEMTQQEMRESMQRATTYKPLQTTRLPSRSASISPPLFHRPSHGESGEGNDPSLNDPNEQQSITKTRRIGQRLPTQWLTQKPPQTAAGIPREELDAFGLSRFAVVHQIQT